MSQALLINPTAMEAGLEAAFQARSSTSEAQQAAFERFAKAGFPHRRVEGWKWSDYRLALRDAAADEEAGSVVPPSAFSVLDPLEIRIVDGRIDAAWDEAVEGLEFGVIDPAALDPDFEHHAIASLNVALTRKAFGFRVKDGVALSRPLHVRHIGQASSPSFSQILARVGEGSEITILETFEGVGGFGSSLFHLGLRDGARVHRVVSHETGRAAIRHGFFGAMLGRGSAFRQTSLSTGGALSRHETNILCSSPSAEIDLASAALVDETTHADFTSIVKFQNVECRTNQIQKGVARDRGRIVFQGKFHVDRPAQRTDAKMTANALLLSDASEANHKPELEIYADDVECAHGSTAGALDQSALFYLRQRGLSEAQARALLIEAFVGEAIDSAPSDAVRDVLHGRVRAWLEAS